MYIYEIKQKNILRNVVSLVSPQEMNGRDLPIQAILGHITEILDKDDVLTSDNFIPNPRFIDFLHDIIFKYAPRLPGMIAEAEKQKEGHVYIIDRRCTTPQADLADIIEDIIGVFEVRDGKILSESYQRNDNHILFSNRGIFKLESKLQEYLLAETRDCLSKNGKASQIENT
jgi:hypothetical protein